MDQSLFEKSEFLRSIIDAIPSSIFIVDPDVRIFFANTAAITALDTGVENLFQKRGGEVLRCIHSVETPEGCGRSDACRFCDLRNSVNEVFGGAKIFRKNTSMEIIREGGRKAAYISISASPLPFEGEKFVLLMLEDINELVDLRSILPICVHCKNIRTDDGYWQRVERYFHSHLGVDFSHSICPACLKELYPQHYAKIIEN